MAHQNRPTPARSLHGRAVQRRHRRRNRLHQQPSPNHTTPIANPTQPITLKVVTFNIQDAWNISTDRPARMRSIGTKLNLLDPDIVGLQEAFIEDEIALLLAQLEGLKLKHHQYYGSATVGNGLLLLSAFPIAEIYFHRYTVANPFYTVWEGDWWVGKGVRLALLVGDMNCSPGEADYERAIKGAGLVRLMNLDTRIDHIFGVQDAAYEFEVVNTIEIQETVSIGGKEFELSDHSGYLSTIQITPTE